jgi:hypothetical protein
MYNNNNMMMMGGNGTSSKPGMSVGRDLGLNSFMSNEELMEQIE